MEKILIISIFISGTLSDSFGNGGYEKAMSSTIKALYQAETVTDFQSTANTFERIGATENDKWLPYYYSAYSYIMMSAVEEDKSLIDGYLDRAEVQLNRSDQRGGDQVEILVLQGFASMMRIGVEPASRGQEYSMQSATFLQKAQQLDATNPRVMLMMGQLQYGTAQFLGSSTEEACSIFRTAIEYFDKESGGEPGLLPTWGKPQAMAMLKKCSQTTK